MIRPRTEIVFQQVATSSYPNRTGKFTMTFVNEFESNQSWKNLTDTAKVIFPKNIIIKRQDGSRYDLSSHRESSGKNIIAGSDPFLMRGDKIKVSLGYYYYDASETEVIPELTTVYEGYVTSVKLKMPIEINCEDNMYILKQVQFPNKVFAEGTTAEDIVKEMLLYVNSQKSTSFTLFEAPAGVTTSVGSFRTMNETVAQVLERMRKDYKINSWFRGNKLHSSVIAYFPEESNPVNPVFVFQQNVISDDLDYTRLDDIKIGATVYSLNKVKTESVNVNGKKKTSTKRLEVHVGDTEGEVRTLFFWGVTTEEKLKALGTAQLARFKYEGFRGSFTTFGEPIVNHGDKIDIRDNILSERNGTYFVKSVTRTTGVNGYRQKIEVDIKVSGFNSDGSESVNLTKEELSKGI